jgi:hypothetical protein
MKALIDRVPSRNVAIHIGRFVVTLCIAANLLACNNCKSYNDCGSGYACSSSGTCVALVSMNWTIQDDCADGTGLQARFFDVIANVQWPVSSQVFETASDGETVYEVLGCYPGDKICYGARPNAANTTLSWGKGIDGAISCDDCCGICGTDNPNIVATCDKTN